jgi:hypothetical protein
VGGAEVIHLPKLRALIEQANLVQIFLLPGGNNPRATQFAYSQDF